MEAPWNKQYLRNAVAKARIDEIREAIAKLCDG